MTTRIDYDPSNTPPYSHLDPIVDLLLENGNSLARDERWHIDMTAIVCYLNNPIDFQLVIDNFDLADDVRLDEANNWIESAATMAMIQGG